MGDLREWIDAIVDNIEQRSKLCRFDDETSAPYYSDNVLISSKHFGEIAKMLGAVVEDAGMVKGYYCYRFFYRGIEFYHLSPERLVQHVDA